MKKNIKSLELCHSCKFDFETFCNDEDTICSECENIVKKGGKKISCKCLTILLGQHCPYYKERTK